MATLPPLPSRTLADWLAYQEHTHPQAIALGLERVRAVADTLGLLAAPPTTIIVAGTNGKGSTTTLLASIYRAAGYTVGAYTSPHLHQYNERIAINGQPVSDAELCAAFTAIEAVRGSTPLTYFEFGTLAALWLFRAVQVQVLEVGLGGRLDAVNMVNAHAALVTNIGLDHQDWLGDTRDSIGREKAGVYRAKQVAVCADLYPPQGLLDAAREAGATLRRRDAAHYAYLAHAQHWDFYCGPLTWLQLPLPALPGAHQLENAAGALALVAGLAAQLPVPLSAIRQALAQLQLPGRMQWQGRVLLDVCHNAEGAQCLASYLATHHADQRFVWLAGMLADKPVAAVALALAPHISHAVCLSLPPPRGLPAAQLASLLQQQGIASTTATSPQQALAAAQQLAGDSPLLVCGSFHTVSLIQPLLA